MHENHIDIQLNKIRKTTHEQNEKLNNLKISNLRTEDIMIEELNEKLNQEKNV